MDQFFAYLERLLIVLSPIIAAYFAYKSAVTQKDTKKYVDLRQKYEKELEEKREAAEKAQQEAIKQMQQDLKDLRREMNDWKKSINMGEVDDKLDAVLTVSKLNFQYSQSLSSVILAIGDVVETSQVGDVDTIKEEMKRHKKEEMNISSSLLKIID